MSDIKLNLINHSSDINNSDYVIFQKNATTDANIQPIAWTVVKNLGKGDNHPFVYPIEFAVGAKDAEGKHYPPILAQNGNAYEVVMTPTGRVLQVAPTPAANPTEVEVWNNLALGSIDAQIYRDGKLLASTANVPPGSGANFQFQPKLFIGAMSQVEQGSVMNPSITMHPTELILSGVSSADIIITGGGAGPSATAFEFTLANINEVR